MKLKILDIEEFIKKNNVKQVEETKIYSKGNKLDQKGLFSEEIFGRLGSRERRKQFGFINLKYKFIHPECWKIISLIDPILGKIINNKSSFKIDDKGNIEEVENNGETGLLFFIKNLEKINFDNFNKRSDYLSFFKKNFDKIFITKYLVLPAGIRDIQTSITTGKTMIQYSEVTNLYKTLIQQIKNLPSELSFFPDDIVNPILQQIQRTLIEINNWFKSRLEGKNGIIRGSLTKKVVDYSGRFIITTDNNIELGYVGLPFQYVIKLFEPFVINYLLYKDKDKIGLELIKNFLKSSLYPDVNDLKRFFTKITEDTSILNEELKQYLYNITIEVSKEKVVLYKRDPVENRDSWVSAFIKVDEDGYVLKLNPLDLPRMGADHDGDTLAVIPVFTKESQKEAIEKMHPRYSKSIWTSVTNINDCPYSIELDAATAIYAATKR